MDKSSLEATQIASTYIGRGFLVDLTGRVENAGVGGGPVVGIVTGFEFSRASASAEECTRSLKFEVA